MSSYICSAKHFDSIEKNLKVLFQNPDFSTYEFQKNGLYFDGKNKDEINLRLGKLVDAFKELNVLAVSFQYSHHYENIDEEIKNQMAQLNIKGTGKTLSNLGMYNALRCLHYQIEFEHIESLRDDLKIYYSILEKLIDVVARFICSKLPEDQTNRWEVN